MLFPVVVLMRRDGLYLALAKPVLETFQAQIQMIRSSGTKLTKEQDDELIAARNAELDKIYPGLRVWHPFRSLLPLAGMQCYFFFAFRKFFTPDTIVDPLDPPLPPIGDFFWIPDLSQADPFGILPVSFALMIALQLHLSQRANMSGINGEPNPVVLRMMRFGIFVAPPVAACSMSMFPSGLILYFCGNAACLLVQTMLTDNPSVRHALGIPVLTSAVRTTTAKSVTGIIPSPPTAAVAQQNPQVLSSETTHTPESKVQ
jgi:hypothetical protein